ncbi:hypothetical protein BGZ99_001767 [Dissophora globulifera]|uniref:Uncharacterized protein n=1 Tax=Dissophora globulifera TaxID=979702 RepID=A0A9P6UXM4_9FUNG|nr:hypothetical protein BGZ99_001767 [Dissophora globulifera]
MGANPSSILKVSLWLQAGSLLVLTSLLADSDAWIGATLTAIGLCFVTIGIGAAHKKSLGYLYCYATLLGAWTSLAVVHVILILGFIAVPVGFMDPVLVIGQKLVENTSDSFKSIVPALYSIQAVAWCTSLACLICLRAAVAVEDPTLGFEIQHPKTRSSASPHTLGSAGRSADGDVGIIQRSRSATQRLFGLGHFSMVAPASDTPECNHGKESVIKKREGQELEDYEPLQIKDEARKIWMRQERRASGGDSSVIYVPRGRRISQVVVTFRDDVHNSVELDRQPHREPLTTHPAPDAAEGNEIVEARRLVCIANEQFSLGDLLFEKPGESLSDIIFRTVDTTDTSIFKEGLTTATTVGTASTMDLSTEIATSEIECKPSTESALRLRLHEQEPTVNDLAIATRPTTNKEYRLDGEDSVSQSGSTANSSSLAETLAHCSFMSSPLVLESSMGRHIQERQGKSEWENDESDLYSSSRQRDTVVPTMQPNSSDPHPCSDFSLPSPLPSLTPYASGHRRYRGDCNDHEDNALLSPLLVVSTPSFLIPTIVLHPDDEDDEPVRVLSETDIDYLSTMPPVPLRQLIQPWEEAGDDDYYEDDCNDGYDYDDYTLQYTQEEEDENEEDEKEEGDDDIDDQEVVLQDGQDIPRVATTMEGEYDPYALDVPINLEIDLQGLEQGDIRAEYGYF